MQRSIFKVLLERDMDNNLKDNLSSLAQGDYYNTPVRQRDIEENPIKVTQSSWQTSIDENDEKLEKTYKMHDDRHVLYFVTELIKESSRMNHHPVIQINHNQVDVVLFTHDLGQVTERDIKLSKFCDELYEDIVFINS